MKKAFSEFAFLQRNTLNYGFRESYLLRVWGCFWNKIDSIDFRLNLSQKSLQVEEAQTVSWSLFASYLNVVRYFYWSIIQIFYESYKSGFFWQFSFPSLLWSQERFRPQVSAYIFYYDEHQLKYLYKSAVAVRSQMYICAISTHLEHVGRWIDKSSVN